MSKNMLNETLKLKPEQLRRMCDLAQLDFGTTSDLEHKRQIIGQPRGVHAIEFGIDIDSPGFNIYVLGPKGTGRTTAIAQFLQEHAKSGQVPQDWVYVYNFAVEHQPRAIEFPPGKGAEFRKDMEALIDILCREVPNALEGEEFANSMEQVTRDFDTRRDEIFQATQKEAQENGFAIGRTPAGLMLAPLNEEGKPMSSEELDALDEERSAQLKEIHEQLSAKLEEALRQIRELDRERKDAEDKLERGAAAFVLVQHLSDLRDKYIDHEEVLLYLDEVRDDVLDNLDAFKPREEAEGESLQQVVRRRGEKDILERYKVNLIVDHSQTVGAPVLFEELPTYANLVGRVEGEVQMGALKTDFTMIKPGSLHKANGGYLILRANDVLIQPGAWDGLKRALQSGQIRIEESGVRTGVSVLAPQTIEPEPIPLDIKVIMMGSPSIYYLLYSLEEDFSDLFKVKSDFTSTMERTPETEAQYAYFIAARCHEGNLPHFTPAAVGQVIEYGARLAGDQNKLSTLFGHITDMLHEATYWARHEGAEVIDAAHMIRAIEDRRYRANLFEELTLERIGEQTIFIDTEGEVVGQINGLSVVGLGDYLFGQPSRITARVFIGKEGVVNIEREVAMSGPIHDKGVLILRGYLGGQYALEYPLALSASITFEQNYSGVEGDSASLAELYALLSALSGYPITQRLAITGSVNQRGQVQPIGGVSEKIEGFFQVCRTRGLTGDQGVIVPKPNVRHLMLRTEVIDAVREGKFHIYAIETVDQGIELLTGLPAGERAEDGTYPEGTLHHAVRGRLILLAQKAKETGVLLGT